MQERVHKLLAQANLGSRRDAEVLIEQGRVRVNGEVIKLGAKADPETDIIEVDGTRIKFGDQRKIYIALFKPKQVLSTHNPFHDDDRQTVYDLVPIRRTRLFSIGRLDADSEGLVVLTNDGEMAQKLSHPKFRHTKTYRVVVGGLPTAETISRWERGIELEDGLTAPCVVKITKGGDRESVLRVVMTEGKKRQIRRVASALGHPVQRLTRVAIGRLTVEDLKPGEWRELTAQEVEALQAQAPEARDLRRAAPRRDADIPAWRRDRPEVDAARRRPRRSEGSAERGDRPPRRDGDGGDRPRRFRRDDEQGERPARRDYQGASDRPRRPRPEASSERGGYRGDRPPRRDADGGDRPRFRRDDEQGERPRRDYQSSSDRPRRPRPEASSERGSYRGDRPPRRDADGGDRPRFRRDDEQGERPPRRDYQSSSDRPRPEGSSERGGYRGDRPPRREEKGGDRPRFRPDDEQGSPRSGGSPRRPRTENDADRPRRRKRSDGSDNHEE